MALLSPLSLEQGSASLLLPLAGIFIGLSFAWGGNAQALLQTTEILDMSRHRDGGYLEYVYTYQAAVLFTLLTLSLLAIAGIGIFDRVWPTKQHPVAYLIVGAGIFSCASITVRECWHVVLGSQAMLIARARIVENKRNG